MNKGVYSHICSLTKNSMGKIFDSNLKLLSVYDSALADRLRFHMPSGRVEVFATPNNYVSMRVQKDGEPQLIHSSQDPAREAGRWVSSLDIKNPYNLMVFGCGLFYHVFQLARLHQSTLKSVVIIEKDIDIVYQLFSTVDLSNFLQTKSTFFVIDPDPPLMRAFMNQHLTSYTLDGLSIIEHPASCDFYPDFYQETRTIIEECLQGGEMLLRTKVALGGMIQENLIRNIPCLFSQPSVSVFGGLFPNVPAFVAGAGPSLDRNMEQLAQIGDRGIIIAVDTVLKPLREKGIQPHIVVTTDPTELNIKHFEGVNSLEDTLLIFSPSVNHKIPQSIEGQKALIPLKSSRLLNLFAQVKNENNPLQTGVNVGQTCFNLAQYLGCDPIVLTGLDFSFPVEGGTTHASGTALQRKIHASDSPRTMKVELLDEARSLEEFEPIYIPGNLVEKVATNKFWLNYLRSMEQAIATSSQQVINCTEGGARVEGAEIRTLSETISSVCGKDHQVRVNLQTMVGFFFGDPNTTEGIAILEESVKILQEAIEFSGKGLAEISALETIANSVSPGADIQQEKLDAIYECHKKLVQDHKVYVVLDEAADSVLQPFLRQDSRPSGDLTSPGNVGLAIGRYRPYFQGMKDLSERYSKIIQETIDEMKAGDTSDPFAF